MASISATVHPEDLPSLYRYPPLTFGFTATIESSGGIERMLQKSYKKEPTFLRKQSGRLVLLG
jgi:hypothetical protein